MFFLLSVTGTRKHSFNGHQFKTEMRKSFFSWRVVTFWNSLDPRAVRAETFNIFKVEIDKRMKLLNWCDLWGQIRTLRRLHLIEWQTGLGMIGLNLPLY